MNSGARVPLSVLCLSVFTVCAASTGSVVQWGDYVLPSIESGTRFKAIASGFQYTFLAVKMDGTVVGWGQNGYGAATVPTGLSNVVAISEATHSLARKSDGTVVAWGENSMGQLAVPAGLSNVVAVRAAITHSLALKSDGTVAAWSDSFDQESTVPPGLSNVIGIAVAPGLSLAVMADGTVFDIGHGTNIAGASNVSAIAADGNYWGSTFMGIRSDGTVFGSWNPNTNLDYPSNTIALALSEGQYLGLLSDGTVVDFMNGVASPMICCATAIAVGGGVLALKTDGSIVEFSLNSAGNSPLWGKLRDVTAIAAQSDFSIALKPEGTVLCWDSEAQAATAGLSNVTVIARGYEHSLALKADGTAFAWGDDSDGQCDIPPGLTSVAAIAAGGYHSLALRSDGTIVGWGYNAYGQASGGGIYSPAAISAGALHNLALMSNSTVRAWGYNAQGQCNVPYGLTNVIAVAAGGAHNLALKADGTVVAWGYNNYGQCNIPPGLSNVIAIAAGGDHSLVLKAGGRIVAWGSDTYGESTVPSDLGPVIAISAGFNDSMAIVLPPTPTLTINSQSPRMNQVVLSWPSVYSGFKLQSSSDLGASNWTDCTNSPTATGTQFFVTNSMSASAQFFRLRK